MLSDPRFKLGPLWVLVADTLHQLLWHDMHSIVLSWGPFHHMHSFSVSFVLSSLCPTVGNDALHACLIAVIGGGVCN